MSVLEKLAASLAESERAFREARSEYILFCAQVKAKTEHKNKELARVKHSA